MKNEERKRLWSNMKRAFTRPLGKDLDLGLFDPFKDVKDGVLLDEEDIAAKEEATEEEQDIEE